MKNEYIIDGKICWVKLTKNKWTQIDIGDIGLVSDMRWSADVRGDLVYVKAYSQEDNVRKTHYMHSLISGTPKGMVTDHINKNTLDNRRSNLRVCTYGENMMNKVVQKECGRNYVGVFLKPDCKSWRCSINFKGEVVFKGKYRTEKEAVKGRAVAFIKYFGEFLNLEQTRLAKG